MIKIDFEFETLHGIYRDAITLPDDHTFSETDIEAMKQQRVDNWIAFMDNLPQPEPDPEYVEIDGVKYLRAE